jgi:hypothetical protein
MGPLLAAAIIGGFAAGPGAAGAQTGGELVDLQLVLAVDVSRSMDEREQRVQRDGYVAAFKSPDVMKAIASGPVGRIAVTYVEWSSASYQRVLVPWHVIGSDEEALVFADALARAPATADFRTSISSGLSFAASTFLTNGLQSERRTIDVSGDGTNNDGPILPPVRERIVEEGITINGLPIMLDPTPSRDRILLQEYYEDCVIGGPAAFVVPVRNLDDFGPAIRRKLILEIVALPPTIIPAGARQSDRPAVDCLLPETDRGFP